MIEHAPLDGEILGPEEARAAEDRVRRKFWPTLRKALRQVPFTHDLVAAYYCAIDPDVPLRVRATLLGALAYFVAPIDAIPDLLLGIGFTDDATILLGAISMVAAHITDRHRALAKKALTD
ncbi:YkvA family protein [Acuticoccus mangrovi]|uniref:DUF1232 domain-containing protein n=1 Tax=Acuticoccus mangrovi TaxID=2796142 RepID=A0A934INR2_9HYPH|nr:YkvA family protein [Acuticoccus mangrovi]MBJ3775763.1 DUF1232 domain-containing protein [Acuticoccus mangrovi]